MAKHPKRPRDPNQLAKLIIDIAVGDAKAAPQASDKNPMASLGREGGLKGGPARAEKLSGDQRVAIARKAAAARWGKKRGGNI